MKLHSLRSAARSAARAGDWAAAAAFYRRLAGHRRATSNDQVQLGHMLKEMGDAPAALEAYRRAAIRSPLGIDPHRQLAHHLRSLGREQQAIDVFARAAVIDPAAADIRAEIEGYALPDDVLDRHMLLGLAGGAPVATRTPNPVAWLLATQALRRARRSARQGDWRQAEHHYRTLLRWDPARAGAHVQLGHALLQQGADREALGSYRRALLLAPRDPDIFVHMGHALKKLGRSDAAFAAYLAAWRAQPGLPAAFDELRGLRPQVDDNWLRAAGDGRAPEAVPPAGGDLPTHRGRLDEPGWLERQQQPYFRFLAGSLALKD